MALNEKANPVCNIAADTEDNEDRYLLIELMLKKGYSAVTELENAKNFKSYSQKDALQWCLYHEDLKTFNLLMDNVVKNNLSLSNPFNERQMPALLSDIIQGLPENITRVDIQYDFFRSFIDKYNKINYQDHFECMSEDFIENLDIVSYCIRQKAWMCLDYLLDKNVLQSRQINNNSSSIVKELTDNIFVKHNLGIIGKLIEKGLDISVNTRIYNESVSKTYLLRLNELNNAQFNINDFFQQYLSDYSIIKRALKKDIISGLNERTLPLDKKEEYLNEITQIYNDLNVRKEDIIDIYNGIEKQSIHDQTAYEAYKIHLIEESKHILSESILHTDPVIIQKRI